MTLTLKVAETGNLFSIKGIVCLQLLTRAENVEGEAVKLCSNFWEFFYVKTSFGLTDFVHQGSFQGLSV